IYVFLVSPNGTVVFSGNFTGTVSGFTGKVTFTIPASITSKLTPGTYSLWILARTTIVILPDQYTLTVTVTS
ncbi:MAG: hypothetical protein ACP5L1_03180, partial [Caldivirga sp.]